MTPLMHAVYAGHMKCLRFFVDVLEDSDEAINGRNEAGTSAMWIAVSRGDEAIIALLKNAGGVLGPLPPAAARKFVPQPHKPATVTKIQAIDSALPSILKLPAHTEDANSKALRLRKAWYVFACMEPAGTLGASFRCLFLFFTFEHWRHHTTNPD